MLKTIIVALDNATTTEKVLHALDILNFQSHPQLVFVHVLSSDNSTETEFPDHPDISLDLRYQEALQQLKPYQTAFPKSTLEIVNGDPAEEIVRFANIYAADLIILGTRGLQGVKRVIEGSVSSQVVAESPCSVLVVKLL